MVLAGTLFSNHLGERRLYDGVSPVPWRVASYVLAARDDGRVLVVETPGVGRWDPPGGEVEPGESVFDAAIRECWEETGYRFVAAADDPLCILEWNFLMHRDQSFVRSLQLLFHGYVDGEQDPQWRQDQDEISAIAWEDPSTMVEARTHKLLWKGLHAAGLRVSPVHPGVLNAEKDD
ncbi:MAG: NUDIX hydrolase [Chloroflexi bacterium]|nr:NUDIX hydrolase [Chloroflexota bacterium]